MKLSYALIGISIMLMFSCQQNEEIKPITELEQLQKDFNLKTIDVTTLKTPPPNLSVTEARELLTALQKLATEKLSFHGIATSKNQKGANRKILANGDSEVTQEFSIDNVQDLPCIRTFKQRLGSINFTITIKYTVDSQGNVTNVESITSRFTGINPLLGWTQVASAWTTYKDQIFFEIHGDVSYILVLESIGSVYSQSIMSQGYYKHSNNEHAQTFTEDDSGAGGRTLKNGCLDCGTKGVGNSGGNGSGSGTTTPVGSGNGGGATGFIDITIGGSSGSGSTGGGGSGSGGGKKDPTIPNKPIPKGPPQVAGINPDLENPLEKAEILE